MLLVVDIGNTNIVIGVYSGDELKADFRITTSTTRTTDEYLISLSALLRAAAFQLGQIDGAIISSVVPALTPTWERVFAKYAGVTPLIVGPGIKTGLDVQYEDPHAVGADRIVNAVAGIALYGTPLIVVDFGTATTLDVLLPKNVYAGGVIVPGVQLSLAALTSRAAKLPQVDLAEPKTVVGKTPHTSMQSGAFFGYLALVDGLIEMIWNEICTETAVVATGGVAETFAGKFKHINQVNPTLTLFGLKLLWEKNQ